MAKVVTVTRKIEFYPIGDNRLDFYSFFQKHAMLQTVAKQLAYNKSMEVNIVSNSINKVEKLYEEDLANLNNSINNDFELIKGLDKSDKKYDAKLKKLNQSIEKNKNKRNNILSKKSIESRKTLEKALGQKESKIIDDMVMMTEDENGTSLKDLADKNTYIYTGTHNAKQDFKNDVKNGLLYGKISPRTYGTFNILDILMSSAKQARNIRKEGQDYLFNMHGFELKVNLGSKPRLATMTKQTLDDVISENVVKVCDSKIQKVGKKFFLLLVLQIEVEQPVLLLPGQGLVGLVLGQGHVDRPVAGQSRLDAAFNLAGGVFGRQNGAGAGHGLGHGGKGVELAVAQGVVDHPAQALGGDAGHADQMEHGQMLGVGTGHAADGRQFAHAVGGAQRGLAAHPGVAVGGVGGVEFVGAADPAHVRIVVNGVV